MHCFRCGENIPVLQIMLEIKTDSNSERFANNQMNTEDAFEDWTAKYVRNVRIQEKCIELMQDYADKKKKKVSANQQGFSK